jgi:alpha-glucosidase
VRQLEQYVGELKQNYLTYNIYPGKDSSYLCYQDDHISMDAEVKQAYRTTLITHQQQNDISVQEISLVRQVDNYLPPEEFYYIALLGQTKAPDSVNSNKTSLSAVSNLGELANSPTNCYHYSSDRQTIFIKIFDKDAKMMILVSGLQALT